MAKAKKSETPAGEPKKVAAAPAAQKSAPKAASKAKAAKPAAAAPAAPMVNTRLAAEAAARMIGAKASGLNAGTSGGERKETSAFKQLKQSFSKPPSVGTMLNNTISSAAKKNNTPFQGNKQVGHNQTFGSDASKNFVPRRTGG